MSKPNTVSILNVNFIILKNSLKSIEYRVTFVIIKYGNIKNTIGDNKPNAGLTIVFKWCIIDRAYSLLLKIRVKKSLKYTELNIFCVSLSIFFQNHNTPSSFSRILFKLSIISCCNVDEFINNCNIFCLLYNSSILLKGFSSIFLKYVLPVIHDVLSIISNKDADSDSDTWTWWSFSFSVFV